MDRLYRLLARLGLLLASTLAVFAFLEAVPGGPAAARLSAGQPVFVQYFGWLLRVLRGDLGSSPSNAEPVSQALVERLPATIELAFFAFVAATALGALIGFLRARARAPALRGVLVVTQLTGRAIPVILLALFLQLAFMFTRVMPTAGITSDDGFNLFDRLRHLVGPVLVLAVPFGAWSSLIFYDLFRASGDAVRPSARSVAGTVAATAALIGPALLSATFFVETWFAWPGLGHVFFNGFSQHDPGLIAGFLLMYFAGIVLLKSCSELSVCAEDRPPPQRRRGFSAIGIVALAVLIGAAFGALAANFIVPWDPYFIDQAHWEGYPLAPGVAGHIMGTDENGRDLLSRLLFAIRTSLGIALTAAVVAAAIAAVAAKLTRRATWFNERGALSVAGIRPFAALPFIFAAVTVLVAKFSIQGVLSPLGIALIIAAVAWPAIVPAFRTLTRASLGGAVDLVAGALLLEVTLSMFGYGVQPPGPSLGNMFVNAQSNLFVAPWIVFYPTAVVIVTLFAIYAVADELR